MAPAASRKGASVVQLDPTRIGIPAAENASQLYIRVTVLGCWHVVIARTFIAQRTIYHDEIRWNLHRSDLAGRRDADEKMATGGEKLLRDQNRKCRADSTTYDAAFMPFMMKDVQFGVVAGPAAVAAGASSGEALPDGGEWAQKGPGGGSDTAI
jgi:hypothetical protein